jgi:hypothetical protein
MNSGTTRWPIVGTLVVVGVFVAGLLVGASTWQNSVHDSRADDAESHSARAALLQDTVREAGVAADLLGQYVQSGAPELIPAISGHAQGAVQSLTNAVAIQGEADLTETAVAATGLADGVGQVIALRQNGDVPSAVAVLEKIRPAFQQTLTAIDGAVALETAEAASLQESADSAESTASWLLTAALVVGGAAGLALMVIGVRAVFRRRVAETASPA